MEEDEVMVGGPNSVTQRKVSILVHENNEEHTFDIDVDLLKAKSMDFKKKLKIYGEDQEIKPLVLENVSVETFEHFTKWMLDGYSGPEGVNIQEMLDGDNSPDWQSTLAKGEDKRRMRTQDPNVKKDGATQEANRSRKNRVYRRLVDLFLFAARYDCPELRKSTILMLQRCVYVWKIMPNDKIISHALESLEVHAPLCRWLILCYALNYNHEDGSKPGETSLPPEFLIEVLKITTRRFKILEEVEMTRPGQDFHSHVRIDSPRMEANWCDFHEHHDEAEREDCESKRFNDPDMLERQMFELLGGKQGLQAECVEYSQDGSRTYVSTKKVSGSQGMKLRVTV